MEIFTSRKEMSPKKVAKKKHSPILCALYYWGKILGINSLNLSKSNELEFSYVGLFYNCFLATIYSYIFYQTCFSRITFSPFFETPIAKSIDMFSIICEFLGTSLTWLILGFRQNRVISIVKSLAKAERTSRELEIPENYEKHFGKIAIYLGFVTVSHITHLTCHCIILSDVVNSSTTLRMLFRGPFIVSFNSMTIFVWSLLIVREKFRRLNNKVRFLMKNYNAHIRQHDHEAPSGLIRTSRWNSSFLSERINKISQLHRELRDVIYCIRKHFDLLVLLGIAPLFMRLTIDGYRAGRNLLIYKIKFSVLASFSYRILSIAIALTIISNICGSTSDEANETGNILHAMLNEWENFGAPPETEKFKHLSLDLLENKVKIAIFDCLDLDHFFVFRILMTLITYLVIILQFDSF